MVTFTKRHYTMIGDMLREMESPHEKKKWFMKWDETFKADNPRYQHTMFHDYVYPDSDMPMEV